MSSGPRAWWTTHDADRAQGPSLSSDEAADAAARWYGIAATATPLPSERDQNFRLDTPAGDRYVLKIANATEQRGILEAQHAVLDRLARATTVCPRVDRREGRIPDRRDRLPRRHAASRPPADVPAGRAARPRPAPLAGAVARPGAPPRRDRPVAGLDHPALHREFHWDVAQAGPVIAAHASGPESDRHTFDAATDERDLRDTYLAQFEMAVRDGGARSVTCAYNRFRGEPACASSLLLDTVLRREWGFDGYVVSDCDAIDDITETHKLTRSKAEASALAVRGGCDLNCGETYAALTDAVKLGLVTETDIDVALRRLFAVRFRLGLFDPPEAVAYARIPYSVVDSPAHQVLALRAARESIVLLKNGGGLLPLRKDVKIVAVGGWGMVPMICSREIPVPGSLPLTIRVLIHVDTGAPRDVRHVYLRGARVLRPDLHR